MKILEGINQSYYSMQPWNMFNSYFVEPFFPDRKNLVGCRWSVSQPTCEGQPKNRKLVFVFLLSFFPCERGLLWGKGAKEATEMKGKGERRSVSFLRSEMLPYFCRAFQLPETPSLHGTAISQPWNTAVW